MLVANYKSRSYGSMSRTNIIPAIGSASGRAAHLN